MPPSSSEKILSAGQRRSVARRAKWTSCAGCCSETRVAAKTTDYVLTVSNVIDVPHLGHPLHGQPRVSIC